jgi:hypothetical protein
MSFLRLEMHNSGRDEERPAGNHTKFFQEKHLLHVVAFVGVEQNRAGRNSPPVWAPPSMLW